MDADRPSRPIEDASTRWSLYAGLYLFAVATVVAYALQPFLVPLGDVLGLPAPFAMLLFASPALLVGPVAWWLLVERRSWYSSLAAAVVGLVTAFATGLLWTLRFVLGWGVEMAVAVWILVGFVLGVAVAVGAVCGLPLMYVRRRGHQDS